jgi:hypothetical protein
MNGPLKVSLALGLFVTVVGAVLWATTDRPVFAVFIVLGVLTGAGAWFVGRTVPTPGRHTPSSPEEPK